LCCQTGHMCECEACNTCCRMTSWRRSVSRIDASGWGTPWCPEIWQCTLLVCTHCLSIQQLPWSLPTQGLGHLTWWCQVYEGCFLPLSGQWSGLHSICDCQRIAEMTIHNAAQAWWWEHWKMQQISLLSSFSQFPVGLFSFDYVV